MKIYLLGKYNNSEILNGPEKFAKSIFNELKNISEDVSFIEYFHNSKNLFQRLFGFEIVNNKQRIFRYGIFKLCYALLKNQPDIIHIVTEERFLIFIFFIKYFLKGKIISTIHGIIRFEIKRELSLGYIKDIFLEYMIVNFSDIVTLYSLEQLDILKKHYNIKEKKAKIIFNGTDLLFHNVRNEFDISRELRIVFYAGNKTINRGTEKILNLFKDIEEIPFKIFILGDEKTIHEYDRNRFYFVKLMAQAQLIEFLSNIHILIKAPVFESFSIFCIECMANGMLIIVPDNIGCSRFIEHEINGFKYNSKTPEEMIKLVRDIYYNKYNLVEISHNASKIVNHLNWNSVAREILKIYQ